MEDYKVVYCLSNTRSFRYQVYNSLKSISKFIDKENILLIINPPSKIEKFNSYATLYDGNDYYQNLDLPIYKYKLEICDIKCDNLIYIDCDTIVKRDITELLDGDYDFFAREEPCRSYNGEMKPTWNEDTWKNNLELYNRPINSIPYNDGFVIFKNRTHNKIKDDLISIYNDYHNKRILSPNTVDDMHHNEFALSIAVSKYKCRNMNETHHWFGWRPEVPPINTPPYVIHIGTNKLGLYGYKENMNRLNI